MANQWRQLIYIVVDAEGEQEAQERINQVMYDLEFHLDRWSSTEPDYQKINAKLIKSLK